MHAHIESLPARRHFSATLDPSFGAGGTVPLRYFPEHTLTAGDAIFVESKTYSIYPAIQKLTSAGKLDTTWGNKGVFVLPFNTFDTWAYDKALGRLVVAGNNSTGNANRTAVVMRFDAAGRPDTTFSDDGVFSYTTTPPKRPNVDPDSDEADEGVSAAASVESLTVLPKGELLVGLRREQSVYDGASGPEHYNFRSTDTAVDVTLLKLRRNGTRQTSYGQNGLTTLGAGNDYAHTGELGNYTDTDVPHIAAVTLDADGGADVTLTRTAKDTSENVTTAFRLVVQHREVNAAGVLDTSANVEWKFLNNQAKKRRSATTFETLLVQPIGDDVRIIGRTHQGTTAGLVTAYDLTPGQTMVAKSIKLTPDGVTLTGITPTRRGYFAVGQTNPATANSRQYAILLNPRLRPITSWGDGGAVRVPADVTEFDAEGRILLAGGKQVSRYLVTAGR